MIEEVTEISNGVYAVHLSQEQPVQGTVVYKYSRLLQSRKGQRTDYWECECGARENEVFYRDFEKGRDRSPNLLCRHLRMVFQMIEEGDTT